MADVHAAPPASRSMARLERAPAIATRDSFNKPSPRNDNATSRKSAAERRFVERRREILRWLALSAVAGAVNTGAFLACQRFVSHVTGTATLIGSDVGRWGLMSEYSLVLVCFVAGAFASAFATDSGLTRSKPLWGLSMLGVVLILSGVAIGGALGAFSAFGGSVEQTSDFTLLSLLSFSMGLLNAGFARATKDGLRTTHLTGDATDVGVFAATAVLRLGDARKEALINAALRAGKLLVFIGGAATMAELAPRFGYLAFLVPAMATLAVSGSAIVRDITRLVTGDDELPEGERV
ncbi:putative transmembrane protein [Labilithrix luteola]|uniref:Putative transmembrane protein n=1 Tax=Labilithrix luteola TaxID=1391654 RepID=A0A0K1PZB3_9BACT|nr:YoaK family protein [Labilithrix luteola]AKU98832.1 putative transmembrane protein [Labilithrix luteola]